MMRLWIARVMVAGSLVLGCGGGATQDARPGPSRTKKRVTTHVVHRFQHAGPVELLGRGDRGSTLVVSAFTTDNKDFRLFERGRGPKGKAFIIADVTGFLSRPAWHYGDKPPAQMQKMASLVAQSSPPGRGMKFLAAAASGDAAVYTDPIDKLRLWRRGAVKAPSLNDDARACYRGAFSPDGVSVAYECFVGKPVLEYCLTVRQLDRGLSNARRFCEHPGGGVSGPYWQPDGGGFYALLRRGFGAFTVQRPNLCLVHVDTTNNKSRALWCRDLDRERDRSLKFAFHMDRNARHGVIFENDARARDLCNTKALRIDLADASTTPIPTPIPVLPAEQGFVGYDGTIVMPSCLGGVVVVEGTGTEVRRHLRERFFISQVWNGHSPPLLLERVSKDDYRLVELAL